MEPDSSQVIFAMLVVTILMLLMSGFIVVMVLFHRQRQFQNRQQLVHIKSEYENTLLKVEKEIREQTLHHVSQELHDNIGQVLSLTKLVLNNPSPESISEGKRLINQLIKEVRSLSKSINMDWVKNINLKEFIIDELQKIEKTGFCETQLDYRSENVDLGLDQSQKLVLIRIIQECLNNAIKHASPSLITVVVEQSAVNIDISVKDNGVGFDTTADSDGLGLMNLQNRMNTIGGKIQISSVINLGTEVKLTLAK